MKKLLLIALTAIIALSFTACGQQPVTYSPANPYWLQEGNYGNVVDKNAKEVCVYDVTFIPHATEPNASLTANFSAGTYTTELSASTYNDTDCYLLTSTLDVTGSYNFANKEESDSVEFNDVSVNKTYFTWNNGITPLYSEQNAESTFPTTASGMQDAHGNRFITIKYKSTVTYGEKDATTTFEIVGTEDEIKNTTPYFALTNGFNGTIKKYNSANYVDSAMLFFAPRSFNFAEGLNYTFSSIALLEHKLHSMTLKTNTAPTVSVNLNLKYNGADITTTETAYQLDVALNGTYKGQAITATYLENATNLHHFMYKLTTPLLYNTGYLVYTLKEVNNK